MSCSKAWRYLGAEGVATSEWTLLLENGVWYFIGTDGTRQVLENVKKMKYYYSAEWGQWRDLDTHPYWHSPWHTLATRLLPYLNSILESGKWGRATVKGWSHHGATRQYGDVGNRCMAVVVDILLLLHWLWCSGYEEDWNLKKAIPACDSLWEIKKRNPEHKADLMEAALHSFFAARTHHPPAHNHYRPAPPPCPPYGSIIL